MAQTFTNLIVHIIFSTKDRRPQIDSDIKPRLHAYLGGIVRELGGRALAINGISDHVHLLIELPPTISLSDAVRTLKTNSSRWVHETWPMKTLFAWQPGYAAFSVSRAVVSRIAAYIDGQERHHIRRPYTEEIVIFLNRHGIEYNERYLRN
ncbi:MAG: IS200/IS605 family transposase [Acidobacteria bacterium]|nr:IS200/IS605 family transposase [Acidobacteriota bacterium]